MSIEVNGNKVDWVKDETVKDLLKRMHYTFPNVVVKINAELVKRTDFAETIVPNNSNIAVIHMISGG